MMTIHVVNRRSRSFGLSWTNGVYERETGLELQPTHAFPLITGSAKRILSELEQIARHNSGNDWHFTLFFKGERVDLQQVWMGNPLMSAYMLLSMIDAEKNMNTVISTHERRTA